MAGHEQIPDFPPMTASLDEFEEQDCYAEDQYVEEKDEGDHKYPLDLQCLETYFPPSQQPNEDKEDPCKDFNRQIIGLVGDVKVDLVSLWNITPQYRQRLQRLHFKKTLKIQSFLWPIIIRGTQSALIVSPPETGKSCAYLVPIIGRIIRSRDAHQNSASKSPPSFLIVSSSPYRAERLTSMACQLIKNDPQVQILSVSCISQINTKRVEKAFQSHVDLLISTPGVLIEMSDAGLPVFENVHYLIFDDGDVCFALHQKLSRIIYLRYLEYWATSCKLEADLNKRTLSAQDILTAARTIVVAEQYTDEINDFVTKSLLPNCIQAFGDLFEYALKQKVAMRLNYASDFDAKINHLIEVMKRPHPNALHKPRIIVSCSGHEEAKKIEEQLTLLCPQVAVRTFTEKNSHFDTLDLNQHWLAMQKHPLSALIISDEMLQLFFKYSQIRDCEVLFHFSFPKNKRIFSARFNLMTDAMTNDHRSTFILYSEQDAGDIIHLYTRLGQQPPIALRHLLNSQPVVYCDNFAAFGKCALESKGCLKNHQLDESEPNDALLPASGQIKFKILELKSANHLIIQLLGHRDHNQVDASWESVEDVNDDRSSKIKSSFEQLLTMKSPPYNGPIKVGEKFMGILEHGKRRVRIEKIINDTTYRVFEIDTGRTTIVKRHMLRKFTPQAEAIPPIAVSCYITGIEPIFGSANWSVYAQELVKYWMYKESVTHATAWVHLATGNKLWIYDVSLYTIVKKGSIQSTHLLGVIEKQLLREKFAATCPKISHYMANDPFFKDTTIVSWTIENLKSKHRWAFLPERQNVYLLQFKTFDQFYVRASTYHDQLQRLEDLLAEAPFVPLRRVLPGLVCVCKFVQGEETFFNRVLVVESSTGGDATLECKVYFLDHGETRIVQVNQLSFIKNEYIERLPYQTIECYMDAVTDLNVDVEKLADQVTHLTRDEDDFYFQLICQRISTQPADGRGKRYKVQLFTFERQSDDGQSLIYHSLACKLSVTTQPRDDQVLALMKPRDDSDDDESAQAKAEKKFLEQMEQRLLDSLKVKLSNIPSEKINRIPSAVRQKDQESQDENDESEDSDVDCEVEVLNKEDFFCELEEQNDLHWDVHEILEKGFD